MIRFLSAILGGMLFTGSVLAGVLDTASFEMVPSIGRQGDPANERRSFITTATNGYTLGGIHWEGLVTPTEAPGEGGFPTYGNELGVRLVHEQSGASVDLTLGTGSAFGPGPTSFSGSSTLLNGTQVSPGDSFSFEFFEHFFDDPEVDPDAVWESITFEFDDEFAPPLDPPGAGIVRFDATGDRTWPTTRGGAGEGFYGVEYGEGPGPSITNLRLEGHDVSTFWFDLRDDRTTPDGSALGDGGEFRVSIREGIDNPSARFLDEDPARHPDTGVRLFPNTFGSLEVDFAAGDFLPGDRLRFGVLTFSNEIGPLAADFWAMSGAELADLQFSGPLSVTLTFDDGSKVTAPLNEPTPADQVGGYIDFDVTHRVAPAAGDSDGDGDVDGDDLLNALLGFGRKHGALPAHGDMDGQGDVDRDDFVILTNNLGNGVGDNAIPAESVGVPEPATFVLWLLALGNLAVIVQSKSRS